MWGLRAMKIKQFLKKFALAVGLMTMSLNAIDYSANIAYAEIIEQTVDAMGEYRLGDNDTRAQAKDLALSDAKRVAAEKVLVYVKSNTTIENFETVKDRIETYTKAKMQILEQRYSFVGEEGTLCQASIVANVKIDLDAIEEEQRAEEQRKIDEQRRQDEEQQRKIDEQHRQEEQDRVDEQRRREEHQRMEEQRRREDEQHRGENQRKKGSSIEEDIIKTIISVVLDKL